MKKINIYSKNKKKFLKLVGFANEVIDILKKLKINPIARGSLAVFIYTKNEQMKVNDIDFLVSEDEFEKVIKELIRKRIRYNYSRKWHVLQIFKPGVKVELDAIHFWQKKLSNNFNYYKFGKSNIKVIGLKDLISTYRKASKTAIRNRAGKLEKYLMLKKLK